MKKFLSAEIRQGGGVVSVLKRQPKMIFSRIVDPVINHIFFRYKRYFLQMGDDLVNDDNDRHPEYFRQIKGFYGHRVTIGNVNGSQDDLSGVAVSGPDGRHDIALGRAGGLAGGGADAHYVYNDARRFSHDGIADTFLHKRKSRAGGGGHGFFAGERRA